MNNLTLFRTSNGPVEKFLTESDETCLAKIPAGTAPSPARHEI